MIILKCPELAFIGRFLFCSYILLWETINFETDNNNYVRRVNATDLMNETTNKE